MYDALYTAKKRKVKREKIIRILGSSDGLATYHVQTTSQCLQILEDFYHALRLKW